MALIELDPTWNALLAAYREEHRHPVNQACHTIGVPLIAGAIPVAATVVGLPLAAGMFVAGWAANFIGHAFEGKPPSFRSDRRQLLTGFIWWSQKMRLPLFR
jgi:uncharacterized membrane protein YGL010W